MRTIVLGVLLLFLSPTAWSPTAWAQSTAFTYQGQLKDGAQPASGPHDFRFRLWTAPTDGSQVGSTQCADNITVANGQFTTTIDFGQQFATSEPRFLEIEVRADTGLGCGSAAGFVALTPRQRITAAPTANHAQSAFTLVAADGSPAPAVFVDAGGNVGVGTTSPAARLHVAGADDGLRLDGAGVGAPSTAWAGFYDSLGVRTGYVGDGSSNDSSIYLASDAGDVHLYTAAGAALTAKPNRNVGVGTTEPNAKLDVRGDIRLGNNGQFRAAAGQEDLRIVRGDIDGDGTVIRGTGFTVTRESEGVYDVTFVPPFSGIPTVTATAEIGPGGEPRWATSAQFFLSASTARIIMVTDGPFTDSDWSLVVIGPR